MLDFNLSAYHWQTVCIERQASGWCDPDNPYLTRVTDSWGTKQTVELSVEKLPCYSVLITWHYKIVTTNQPTIQHVSLTLPRSIDGLQKTTLCNHPRTNTQCIMLPLLFFSFPPWRLVGSHFQQKLVRPLGTQAVSYPRTRLLEKATGGCPRSHLDVSVPSSGLSWSTRPGPETRRAAHCYSPSPEHITTNWRTKN